jgi:hypothetical protein
MQRGRKRLIKFLAKLAFEKFFISVQLKYENRR